MDMMLGVVDFDLCGARDKRIWLDITRLSVCPVYRLDGAG